MTERPFPSDPEAFPESEEDAKGMASSAGRPPLEKENAPSADSLLRALQEIQKEMEGAAQAAGFLTEEDVAEWVSSFRREESRKRS
jgi:hypothetical protein